MIASEAPESGYTPLQFLQPSIFQSYPSICVRQDTTEEEGEPGLCGGQHPSPESCLLLTTESSWS